MRKYLGILFFATLMLSPFSAEAQDYVLTDGTNYFSSLGGTNGLIILYLRAAYGMSTTNEQTIIINTQGVAETISSFWQETANTNAVWSFSTNKLIYNGQSPANISFSVSTEIDPVSGANQAISLYLYKNDIQEPRSRKAREVSSGKEQHFSMLFSVMVEFADELMLKVANDSGTKNLRVSNTTQVIVQ